ncbi:MAG TPA: fumarylacetoacetate hydrolase family protein [Enterococcus columbae]|nr:fumarylacetoacetate hydrolase family protein [Enterococcus columbae]
MKFVQIMQADEVIVAFQDNWRIIPINQLDIKGLNQIKTLKDWIIFQENHPEILMSVNEAVTNYQGNDLTSDEVTYAPVIHNPEKIICVGLNYRSHIIETKRKEEEFPEFFAKTTNSLNAHNQTVYFPKSVQKLDYEAELVIIVGKTAYEVSQAEANEYIWGYTIGNDFSARDLQKRRTQWYLGKGLDGFAPIGPYAVRKEDFNLQNAEICLKRNDLVVQKANVNQLIFKPDYLISHISQYMTLKPGDIIFTGTPEGVIMGKATPDWLTDNETLAVTIEGIGTLINQIKIKEN